MAATSPAARDTRPPEGQAFVDDPEGARQAVAEAFAAGPTVAEALLGPGTAMSYDARSREDWELNTLFFDHESYVFHPGDPAEGGPEFSGDFVGVKGYIEAMNQFAESWLDLRVDAGPVKVLDETRALSVMHWSAQGIRSGMEMKWSAFALFEFRDGLIVDQKFWWSLDAFRRALGDEVPADW